MPMNRRDFLKSSALTGSGLVTLGVTGCINSENKTSEKNNLTGLEPIKDIQPISLDERKNRIEKARELMAKNKIDAIIIEPGS